MSKEEYERLLAMHASAFYAEFVELCRPYQPGAKDKLDKLFCPIVRERIFRLAEEGSRNDRVAERDGLSVACKALHNRTRSNWRWVYHRLQEDFRFARDLCDRQGMQAIRAILRNHGQVGELLLSHLRASTKGLEVAVLPSLLSMQPKAVKAMLDELHECGVVLRLECEGMTPSVSLSRLGSRL